MKNESIRPCVEKKSGWLTISIEREPSAQCVHTAYQSDSMRISLIATFILWFFAFLTAPFATTSATHCHLTHRPHTFILFIILTLMNQSGKLLPRHSTWLLHWTLYIQKWVNFLNFAAEKHITHKIYAKAFAVECEYQEKTKTKEKNMARIRIHVYA